MIKYLLLSLLFLFVIDAQAITGAKALDDAAVTVAEATRHSDLSKSTSVPLSLISKREARRDKRQERLLKRLTKRVKKLLAKPGPDRPARPKEGKGSSMAIASMVLGIVSIVIYPLFICGILALIFGIISLKRYNEGYHDRRGMAIAGIVMGSLSVLALLILIFAIIVAFSNVG